MTKKQVLRFVCFMVATLMLIVLLCDMFEGSNNSEHEKSMYTYKNLPEDTVDAVFLGTSGVDVFWVAPLAYEEYGLSLYNLAYPAMPAFLYTNIIEEIKNMQDTKLILIDIRAFFQSNTKTSAVEVRARRYLDSLPFFSPNRIKGAFKTVDILHKADPENCSKFDASYLFPFIKYHTKWADDYSIYDNLGGKDHNEGSYYMKDGRIVKIKKQNKVVFDSSNPKALDPVSEEALYDLIDYIKEKDLNVLFVDTPQFLAKTELRRASTVYKILEENGMNYLHFYKEGSDEFTIDLDNTKDFFDASHVNFYGAQKFTRALSEYLKENYDLPDRRESEVAKNFWEGKYDNVLERIEKFETERDAKKKK